MFQAQAKMNNITFIHRNEIRRTDKTFSDERRIKQILITILSNALNMITKGTITFKIGLDRNEQSMNQSFTDSPTTKNHPSLRFEIEVAIDERQNKNSRDVCEEFE